MEMKRKLWAFSPGFAGMILALLGLTILAFASFAARAQADPAVGVGYVDHGTFNSGSVVLYKNSNILIAHEFVEDDDHTLSEIKAANPNVLALQYNIFFGTLPGRSYPWNRQLGLRQ